ncbi:hypothetical protein BMETH_1181_1 [methanotrophic bacterial endosymbiont of Bathymodiolus sp.]|nr:hypothetical protein BMETH_1181_1 [methanotrophic bacterial endosymbiont of Bathymodiolus sp.]
MASALWLAVNSVVSPNLRAVVSNDCNDLSSARVIAPSLAIDCSKSTAILTGAAITAPKATASNS